MFDAYPCTHTTGQKLSSGTRSSTVGARLQPSLEVCCHFPLLAELSRSRPAAWSTATGTGGQFNRNMQSGSHWCFAWQPPSPCGYGPGPFRRRFIPTCRASAACSPSRKRADHPAFGLSVAVSRITKLHTGFQFFSAALFLDGPAIALRGRAHACRMLAKRSHF